MLFGVKKDLKKIKTIDLWTEPTINQHECFNGAFVDGFSDGNIPFNTYKVIRNCNCYITVSREDINISNKHHAIVFYKDEEPVRLVLINRDTNVERCIKIALNQYFEDTTLREVFQKANIQSFMIDMDEDPVFNNADFSNEIDVGSCDRWSLLYSMLKGNYTEDDTHYGNYESDKYEFIPNLIVRYNLKTDTEEFYIEHKCAFINDIKTRLIPIQEHSPLTGLNK
jgi:hypothetical protein